MDLYKTLPDLLQQSAWKTARIKILKELTINDKDNQFNPSYCTIQFVSIWKMGLLFRFCKIHWFLLPLTSSSKEKTLSKRVVQTVFSVNWFLLTLAQCCVGKFILNSTSNTNIWLPLFHHPKIHKPETSCYISLTCNFTI